MRRDRALVVWSLAAAAIVAGHDLNPSANVLAARAASQTHTLTTGDGLSVAFDGRGAVASMKSGGKPLPLAADGVGRSGWRVTDARSGRTVNVRNWTFSAHQGSLVADAKVAELGVDVHIEYRQNPSYVRAVGTVTDGTGKERALDLTFGLPIDATGWLWDTDITERLPIADRRSPMSIYKYPATEGLGPPNSTRLTGSMAAYPFVAISGLTSAQGIALAIPADMPMVFDGGYAQGLLSLTVKVGTSPFYKTPNVTPFQMMLFSYDARWGFRDVLRRYYTFFPQYFTDRASVHGLGTSYLIEDSRPEDLAFHLIDDPAQQARTVEEYEKLGGIAFARSHHLLSFPYTIWGQRQVFLKRGTLVTDPDEAWKAMEAWQPDVPMYYATALPALNYASAAEHKQIIESSVVYGPDQKPVVVSRKYWNKSALTFPTNPDPDLFADRDVMTVGKFYLKYYRHLLEHIPDLAGIFHDSQYGWGLYFNFRREHFKYADRALSYHPVSKEVCLYNQFSLNESLEALHKLFPDKLVLANGLRPNFVYNMFPADIAAVELIDVSALRNAHQAAWYRMMAGPKPVLVWSYKDWDKADDIDEFWQRSLLYGYALSARGVLVHPVDMDLKQGRVGPEIENADRKKYAPALQAIATAGWQPVTNAWIDPRSDVQIERFGPGRNGHLYFTIFNSGRREATVTVTIDARALGSKPLSKAVSLVGDHRVYTVSMDGAGIATAQVNVPGMKTLVLQVQ